MKNFLLFLDIRPVNTGHILLIPKEHFENVYKIPDPLYTELFQTIKILADKLKEASKAKKIGLVIEGFGVPHAHVHLVPINNPHDLNTLGAQEASKETLLKTQKEFEKYFAVEDK